jgi:hypothetical protein
VAKKTRFGIPSVGQWTKSGAIRIGLGLVGLFAGLFALSGCSTGNCRSQKEAAKAQIEVPRSSIEGLVLMKESSKGQRVKVYKFDGSLQCNQGRQIPLDEMLKSLGGIKVYSSQNLSDGKMRIQLCGSPTGKCNVYEIDRESLDTALKEGFKEWVE